MKLEIVLSIIGVTVDTVCSTGILVFVVLRRKEAIEGREHKNDEDKDWCGAMSERRSSSDTKTSSIRAKNLIK